MSFSDEYLKLREQRNATAPGSVIPQTASTLPKVTASRTADGQLVAASSSGSSQADEPEEKMSFWDRLRKAVGLTSTEEPKPATVQKTDNGDAELDAYLKQIQGNAEKATADEREGVDEVNYPKLLAGAVLKGVNQFDKGLTATADWLIGQPLKSLGWENNPISKLNQKITEEGQYFDEKYAENASKSVPAQLIDKYGTATVAAIPQAALALVTAGSSLAAQGTTAGLEAASAAAGASGLAGTIGSAVQGMAKNPQYWASFLQVAGTGYEQAKEDGADDLRASAYAMTNGLINAMVEIGGGGIQELPAELRSGGSSAVRKWIDTMLDEGKEEVVQGVIERGLQNVIYQKSNPLFSTTDENAIFNPKTMLEEAAGGAVVGGVLGGGQMAVASALHGSTSADAPKGEISPSAPVESKMGAGTEEAGNGQEGTPGSPGSGLKNDGASGTVDSTEKRINRALEMLAAKRPGSEIFNETGLVSMNGMLADGFDGPVVWRADNGNLGTDLGNREERQSAGRTETAVSGDDGRGASGVSSGGVQRPAWEQLGEQRQRDAEQAILRFADRNLTEEQAVLRGLYEDDAEFARDFYKLYTQGDGVAETWRAYIANPAELIRQLDEINAESDGDGLGAANKGFTTTPGQQVQTQNKTVTQSKYMTEEEKARLAPGTHEQVTAEMSAERAGQNFYTDSEGNVVGLDVTVEELLNKEAWTATDQDTAQVAQAMLIQQARKDGDWSRVTELAKAIERQGTVAGQSLQARQKWIAQKPERIVSEAATILDGLPEGTGADALDTVAELAEEYDASLSEADGGGLIDIIRRTAEIRGTAGFFSKKLSKSAEWALKRVVDSGDTDFLRTLAANGIVNIAKDTVKPTFSEGVKTYRRLSMLSKVSTTMRNLVSNGVFDITDTCARDVSVPLDMLLSKFTGTRSVAADTWLFSEAKRKGTLDGLAKSMLEVGLDVDTEDSGGKYESTANRTFKMSGGVVSRLLSTWEKYSGYAMTSTDAAAKGGTAAEVQRGIDKLYNRGLIKDESLRDAGKTEALYRTFQDKTKLSSLSLKLRDAANELEVGGIGLGDIALPFAKTPANLASRALEYSPLGLAKSGIDLARTLKKARSGELTAAEQAKAVQGIGRGLNGTGLIALSTAAALVGIIKTLGDGRDDEDGDMLAMAKMAGQSGTQINLDALIRWLGGGTAEWQDGDTLMSIGFLDPLNAQLTTGALIADDIRNGDVSLGGLAKDSAAGTLQAVMDMPVMSTFAEAAEAYYYSQESNGGGKLMDALMQFGAGQVSSLIPNAVKGIAQGSDPVQRNAYSSDSTGGQVIDSVKASLPGLRETLPAKTDSYGSPLEYEGGVLGWLNANILPGSVSHYHPATATPLLDAIFEATGNAAIYPERKAPGSFSFDGEKISLDYDEKQKYLETAGGAYEAYLKAVENSVLFSVLSTEQQADVLERLKEKAAAAAKAATLEGRGIDPELSEKEKAIAAFNAGDLVTYLSYITGYNALTDGATAQEAKAMEELLDQKMPDSVGRVILEGDFGKMVKAEEAGVSVQDYFAVREAISALTAAEGYESPALWQKLNAIGGTKLSDEDKLTMIKQYGESVGERIQTAYDAGVPLDAALAYYEAISARNADGTNKSSLEKKTAVYAIGLTDRERVLLERAFG